MSINDMDSDISGGNMEDVEFFEDDISKPIKMNFYYQTKYTQHMAINTRDQLTFIYEITKKVLSNTMAQITDIEMNKKIPYSSANQALSMCERVILPSAGIFDNSQNDYLTNGLIEDQEPPLPNKDAWIRSRIQVDQKSQELYDGIGNLPGPSLKKRSPDQRSVYSSKSKTSSSNFRRHKEQQKYNPLPIDLAEPVFVSEEEEKLRNQKEEERIKKEKNNIFEIKKRNLEHTEEQMKLQKLQKEKNVIGTTYDYTGELLPVQKQKLQKLPPSAYNMQFEFKDPVEEILTKKKTRYKKSGIPKSKKTKETTQPDLQKGVESQPPILENISLAPGVTITFDGRRRQGNRPSTLESQTLTMASLNPSSATNKYQKKIRLRKSEYDDIINNQQKLGSHKVNKEDNQRMASTQDNPRDMHMFGKTMDSVYFATKLKNKTLGRTLSSTQEGGIQINSIRNFEQMNNQINEEDEFLMQMVQQKEKEEQQKIKKKLLEQKLRKTPVDEFNQNLAYNKEWGKQHYDTGTTLMNYPFGLNKPGEKEQITSLGTTQKPRSRMAPKTPETFDVRVNTADNGFRPGTKEGLRSQQGIRIRVTRNNQNQMQSIQSQENSEM